MLTIRRYAMTVLTVALIVAAVWLAASSWAGAAEAVDQYATSTPPVPCCEPPELEPPAAGYPYPAPYPGPLPTREMIPFITWDPYPGPGEDLP